MQVRIRTGWLLVLLLLSSTGARAEDKRKRSGARSDETVKQGKILVVRGAHGGEAQLTDEDGKNWLMDGVLKEELLRLDGHKLKVWVGPSQKKLSMNTLEAHRYEIMDSGDGRRPQVGLLRRKTPQGYFLETPQTVLQIEAKRSLLTLLDKWVSCKIWLVGDLEGQTLKAFKFGWIHCKKEPSTIPGKENKK
jgi:hypothetical protein